MFPLTSVESFWKSTIDKTAYPNNFFFHPIHLAYVITGYASCSKVDIKSITEVIYRGEKNAAYCLLQFQIYMNTENTMITGLVFLLLISRILNTELRSPLFMM